MEYHEETTLFTHTVTEELDPQFKAFRADPRDAEKCRELMSLSRAMMLVRSDLPLALNARKEVMLSLAVDDENIRDSCLYHVEAELQLLVAIFTLHIRRAPVEWHHRRWCLSLRYLLQREKKKGKEKTFINKMNGIDAASSLCTISSASRPSQNKDGAGIGLYHTHSMRSKSRSLCTGK